MPFDSRNHIRGRKPKSRAKRQNNGPLPLPPAKESTARTGTVPEARDGSPPTSNAPEDAPTKSRDTISKPTAPRSPAPLSASRGHNHAVSKSKNKAQKVGKPSPIPAQTSQARADAEKRVARAQAMSEKSIRKRKEAKHAGEAMKPTEYGYLL